MNLQPLPLGEPLHLEELVAREHVGRLSASNQGEIGYAVLLSTRCIGGLILRSPLPGPYGVYFGLGIRLVSRPET